jgi:hypothetical protein
MATTSATFFPQLQHRIRLASFASVTDLPAIRASVSGSMCRDTPHGQVTRTTKSPRQWLLPEASRAQVVSNRKGRLSSR